MLNRYKEVAYLTEKEIKYVIDNKERKLGREQRQEPLRCVHVSSKTEIHEMIKQIRQLFLHVHNDIGNGITNESIGLALEPVLICLLEIASTTNTHSSLYHFLQTKTVNKHLNKSFKLVKLKVQFFKALSKQVAQSVLVHNSHKNTKCLLFRHLNTHIQHLSARY